MSTSKKVSNAFLLLGTRKVWGGFVNIFVLGFLARNLSVEDFGIVAISSTLISFIQVLGISGIGEYVVFYKPNDEVDKIEIRQSAFWLSFFAGLIVIVVVILIVPFWSVYYESKQIRNITYLLLIGFFFTVVGSIPHGIFRRNLNYKPLVQIQLIFGTFSQLSQVLFILLDFGIYSLVLPNAIITPIMTVVIFWKSGFIPNFKSLVTKRWKEIFLYTKYIIGGRILNKFANEGDTLIVGKLLGMEALGIYNIAYRLSNFIFINIAPLVNDVSLPLFAKNRDNLIVVRKRFLDFVKLLMTFSFPLYTTFIAFAPYIVEVVYGSGWSESVIPLQILSFFIMFRFVSSPTSGVLNALGRPRDNFWITAVTVPLLISAIYFMSSYGIIAVCISISIVRIVAGNFRIIHVNELLGIAWVDYLKLLLRWLVPSVIAISIIILIREYFIFILFYQLVVFMLTFVLPVILLNRIYLRDTFILFRSKIFL